MSFNNASDAVNVYALHTVGGRPSEDFPLPGRRARGWARAAVPAAGRAAGWAAGQADGGGAVRRRAGMALRGGREQRGENDPARRKSEAAWRRTEW